MAKPEKMFRIHFDVPASKLSTIVSLVSDEVSNLVIRDTSTLPSNQVPAVPTKRTRMCSPRKGGTALSFIHDALSGMKVGETLMYQKIIDILERNNLKGSSHTSIISGLVVAGYMKRTERNTLKILKPMGR